MTLSDISTVLLLCGSLIQQSGLDKSMALCGLSTVGSDSLVSVNHTKMARYCIQVAACVMFSLLTSAHEKGGDKGTVLQCLKIQCEESERNVSLLVHNYRLCTFNP